VSITELKAHVKNIDAPEKLKSLNAWLVWRYEDHGEQKPRKIPYYIDGTKRRGEQGAESDRNRLATFEAAKAFAARKGYDGIGFALMPDFNITALDFDNCITAQGIDPQVQALIANTYAEYSPSGKGIRAFVTGSLPDRKDTASASFGFETFNKKGYVTVTGQATELTSILGLENTLSEASDDIYSFYESRFSRAMQDDWAQQPKAPLGITLDQFKQGLSLIDPDISYDHWLKLGMAIHFETQGSPDGFKLFDQWSAKGTKYPGHNALRSKWLSFNAEPGSQVISGAYFLRMANDHGAKLIVRDNLEAFDQLAEGSSDDDQPSASDTKPMRFAPVPAATFSQGKPPTWLIKHVLPEAALALLIGPPGSGKSFIALDMAFAIAQGIAWRDHKTQQGRVVIIAAEGVGGMRKRVQAYGQHHGLDLSGVPVDIIPAAPDFLNKDDALDLAKAIHATGGARLVIVDTFAQVTPGSNENSGEDMGKALKHCEGIHRATGALVMLVHHVGKDSSKGARGWSGLKGAADCEIEVGRVNGSRFAKVSKQKDGDDQGAWGFDLEVVPLGMDEDGDTIDSCVVVEAELTRAGGEKSKYRGAVLQAFELLSNEVPADGSGVALDYLVAELASQMKKPESGRDRRKERARRAVVTLLEGEGDIFFLDGDDMVARVV